MNRIFEKTDWDQAIRGISSSVIVSVKELALTIVSELPVTPGEQDWQRVSQKLDAMRSYLSQMKRQSKFSSLLPEETATREELVLWITGLVHAICQ